MTFKKCGKCSVVKMTTEFYKRKRSKDGLRSACKSCDVLSNQKYYETNSDKVKKLCNSWRLDNQDKVKELKKNWVDGNRDKVNSTNAKRRAAKLNATPSWLSEFDYDYIKSIYKQGNFLDMHIDHIVPLQGKNVCGLHVPWNLQLLSPEENLSKGNRYE